MIDFKNIITSEEQIQKFYEWLPVLKKMPIVEVAEILLNFENNLIVKLLDEFTIVQRGRIFAQFPLSKQIELFKIISKKHFAEIFEHIPSDIRADLFQYLTLQEQSELLPYLKKNIREDVIKLSSYPSDTAGGIMSTDFATVHPEMTCFEAINKVRADAPSKKTVYYIYVVDDNMQLIGFITLKDIIMASPNELVKNALHSEYVYANVVDDKEQVARKIKKYNLVAIPVINNHHQLVGIVTHEDALDVIEQEHTEDLQKFMGIMDANKDFEYLKTPSWFHFKKRVIWVVALAAIGIISGIIIHSYENALQKLLILALYMPMVADTGGNVGSQAATVVVRAIALNQINLKDWLKVLWKETKISILLALCLGLLAFVKILFLSWEIQIPNEYSLIEIAWVISLALCLQVVTATIIGAFLPLAVKSFGGDPAVAASPAITTIVDITGLLIYFGMATILLNF